MLRIRDVYPGSRNRIFSFPDPNFFLSGSEFFPIPDPNFYHPRSRIRIKELKYFNQKNCFLGSRKYDPGCSSPIQILILLTMPDPGSRGQKGTGSWIRILNTGGHHRIKIKTHIFFHCCGSDSDQGGKKLKN